MTKDTDQKLLDMAREAGIRDVTCDGTRGCLERLVELARADEREENAKVCDAEATVEGIAQKCAAAIRERGNT